MEETKMVIKGWYLSVWLILALLPFNAAALEFEIQDMPDFDEELADMFDLDQDADGNVRGDIDYIRGVTTNNEIYDQIAFVLNLIFGGLDGIDYTVLVDTGGNIDLLGDNDGIQLLDANSRLLVEVEILDQGLIEPEVQAVEEFQYPIPAWVGG